ncbi:MAG TPA: GTPase Era [Ignavibacteriales bacterium]|nr:GTPase Era [Ignavibacteriales bacterium]
MAIKSGYATIIGKPNVGKSTLLNALLGEKLSIATNKPQTTRKNILGILSDENSQIIFFDTPGILKPNYLLQEKMLQNIQSAVNDADVLLFIIDIEEAKAGNNFFERDEIKEYLKRKSQKKILLINKMDLLKEDIIGKYVDYFQKLKIFDKVIPTSAIMRFNVNAILDAIMEYLPEHPKYYPDDILTIEPERFVVSEIIREKVFELYSEEIPYSVETIIEDFKERPGRKDFIQAAIAVEKESQKPIIIGKGGAAIKQLGQLSREAIEAFLQRPVYLELRVIVRPKWRSDEKLLKSFGYTRQDEE